MIKVLIADDEKNICLMIQKLISWEKKGMEVIGLVHNGIDAVKLMEEEPPDIIISDIRMPGYDGLELVKKARSKNLSVDFIIISGYKHFEYAHTALNLGVEHYLLKPIDQKELDETLDKIVRKRTADLQKARAEAELKEEALSSRRKVQKHFLSSIMGKGRAVGELELNSVNSEFQCEFEQGCFIAVFAKIDCDQQKQDLSGLLHLLEGIIDQDLGDSGKEYINSLLKSGVMTILNYRMEQREELLAGLEKPMQRLRRELDKFQGFHITVGVGSQKNSIRDIASSMEEAIYAVKCRSKAGLDRVIHYQQLRYVRQPREEILDQKRQKEIENMTEALDYAALLGEVKRAHEQIRAVGYYSPATLYDYLEQVSHLLLQVFKNNQMDEAALSRLEDELEQVLDFYINTEDMMYQFVEVIRAYFEQVIAERKNRSQLPIRMAKQYVLEHYQGQVTLEEVSEAIGLSPAYLSTMFKKELRINFSEYLISCRIEASKELLKNTDRPIAEVAKQVGYTDSRHFSKTFTKVVGLKPSVYRKLYL